MDLPILRFRQQIFRYIRYSRRNLMKPRCSMQFLLSPIFHKTKSFFIQSTPRIISSRTRSFTSIPQILSFASTKGPTTSFNPICINIIISRSESISSSAKSSFRFFSSADISFSSAESASTSATSPFTLIL